MKRTGSVLILALLCSTFSFGQKLIRTEVLGRPSSSGIVVQSVFDSAVEARILYGTLSGVYSDSTVWQYIFTDSTSEAVVLIQLSGLAPDTKYYYHMQFRSPGSNAAVDRPEYSFHTARARGSEFVFTVQADPHLDPLTDTALYRRCLKNQLEDAPDFMIELGDFLMTDKLKDSTGHVPEDTIPYRCRLLRSFYESVCHSIPLYIVLGNHEGETGWFNNGTEKNLAVWDTRYRKKYFTNPQPGNFYSGDTTLYDFIGLREATYSWEWGDALFVVLDPYWNTSPKPDSLNCWRWTLGKMQYDWLRYTLENSSATFKFVFIHQLAGGDREGRGGVEYADFYEWGGMNIDSTAGWTAHRPGWYKPVRELLEENKVNIFFHGHDHLYAGQQQNCLIYQEVPQPGLPNFTGIPQAADYGYVNGVIIPNSGHLRVTVSPDSVRVDYIRAVRPQQETPTLHNRDISVSYSTGAVNCYDTLHSGRPVYAAENGLQLNISPNPYSDAVSVTIRTKDPGRVRILLFDPMGRYLSTLFDDHLQAGSYTLELNPDVWPLKPGIYYCRAETATGSKCIKLICIK